MSQENWKCASCGLFNRFKRRKCQACFGYNINIMSEHEERLRNEWKRIISNGLPEELQIGIIIKNISEYSYPIYYGVYAAFVSTLILINPNGQCKYKWHDTYWESPLNTNVESKSDYGSIEYFQKIGKNKIKYHSFEKWEYDFKTNTLTLRAFDTNYMFSTVLISVGKLCYGNQLNTPMGIMINQDQEQSEYEWHFKFDIKSKYDIDKDIISHWNEQNWNSLIAEKSEIKQFFFMNEL